MESIQSFLMSWLHDSGTDTEYLRIQFSEYLFCVGKYFNWLSTSEICA